MSLQELIEELAVAGANLRILRYSGRWMFGRECLAVATDDPLGTLQRIAIEAGKRGIDMPDSTHQDALGRGSVLYWPDVPFIESEDKCRDHNLTYKQHDWVEGHGEPCHQEWWECTVCGAQFDSEEEAVPEDQR